VHIALLEFDRLFSELERFKAERGWYNLNLTRAGIRALLGDHAWYRLQIPRAQLAFDSMSKVTLWQEIAAALLKKYVEHYYTFRERAWELPHLEYLPLETDDPNLSRPPLPGPRCRRGPVLCSLHNGRSEVIGGRNAAETVVAGGSGRAARAGGAVHGGDQRRLGSRAGWKR